MSKSAFLVIGSLAIVVLLIASLATLHGYLGSGAQAIDGAPTIAVGGGPLQAYDLRPSTLYSLAGTLWVRNDSIYPVGYHIWIDTLSDPASLADQMLISVIQQQECLGGGATRGRVLVNDLPLTELIQPSAYLAFPQIDSLTQPLAPGCQVAYEIRVRMREGAPAAAMRASLRFVLRTEGSLWLSDLERSPAFSARTIRGNVLRTGQWAVAQAITPILPSPTPSKTPTTRPTYSPTARASATSTVTATATLRPRPTVGAGVVIRPAPTPATQATLTDIARTPPSSSPQPAPPSATRGRQPAPTARATNTPRSMTPKPSPILGAPSSALPTAKPISTATAAPPTFTPSATPTRTPSPTPTPSATPTRTPSSTPTPSATPTRTPSPTPTPSVTPTRSPSPTLVPTIAPTATSTMSPTSPPTPTEAPPAPTATAQPTPISGEEPPSETPTEAPTVPSPEPSPTDQPPEPTQTPSVAPAETSSVVDPTKTAP